MKFKSSLLNVTRSALVLSAIALSVSAMPAHAAKFGVRVVDDNGSPVAGAAVCIGLQGNYKQFAATFTDGNGLVSVEVPNVPLLVTVSTDRFTGSRTSEPARSFNLIKEVQLKEGIPGPRCKAGSVLAEHKPTVPTIVVTDIAIFDGSGATTLSPTVSGQPNEYRVSDTKEFDGARWRSFTNEIALAGNLAASDKVFLQMRKFSGTPRANIEARSNVMTVRLN